MVPNNGGDALSEYLVAARTAFPRSGRRRRLSERVPESHASDDSVGVLEGGLDSVKAGGGEEMHAGCWSEMTRDADFPVVPHLAVHRAVEPLREIVGVALCLQRVTAAPDDDVAAPGASFQCPAPENAEPSFRGIEGSIGNVMCHDGMTVEDDPRSPHTMRPLEADRDSLTLTDCAVAELLAAFVNDVPLRMQTHRRGQFHGATVSCVEPFTMRWRVESLPVDPSIVLDSICRDQPLKTHLLTACKRQRLSL